jgi:hypothetical protein
MHSLTSHLLQVIGSILHGGSGIVYFTNGVVYVTGGLLDLVGCVLNIRTAGDHYHSQGN